MNLTEEQKKALRDIEGGADIWSPALARTLRDIHNKAPELLWITKPMTVDGDGTGALPYFGAMATRKGLEAAQEIDYEGVGEVLAAYRRSKRVSEHELHPGLRLLERGNPYWDERDNKSAIIRYLNDVDSIAARKQTSETKPQP